LPAIKALPDNELIALIKQGDEAAYAEIHDRYYQQVYRFIRKYLRSAELSEDICQNVFFKFWETRDQPFVIREVGAWLFTVAKRQSFDFLKRASIEQAAMGLILANYPENSNPEEAHITKDYLQFIENVLNTMPQQTREVFQLCRQQHKTYDEAAEILGITRHTVKKHMVRSMKLLKDAAENELGISFLVVIAILTSR